MKNIISTHGHNVYLKPGEVLVSREPLLVSTVLGSCVAITLFSPSHHFGAICHAMLPENAGRDKDLRYVDTALEHIHRKILQYGIDTADLMIKMFGGAQVLDVVKTDLEYLTIGDQNVKKAEEVLTALGYIVSARDTGGLQGRKLFFCTRSGDVYVRRMRRKKTETDKE